MIAAIIQARMGSSRLPGKVLKQVNGIPLLEYQINRVKRSKLIDEIIVATSTSSQDDQIYALCEKIKVKCFRGSENDVLLRYYECAKKFKADVIVRLTADCPLIDPAIIDNTIKLYQKTGLDYAANTIPPQTRKFPDGFDVEVFSSQALERTFKEAPDPHDREHVTFYMWKYDFGFKTAQLEAKNDYSKFRFTVDYPEDFQVVEFIVNELAKKSIAGNLEEIISIIEAHPEIKEINSKYFFGIGWNQGKINLPDKKGKIVATIECRMTSSRLLGKVLLEGIDGKSMLEVMVERVKAVKGIDQITLATTTNKTDDVLERLAGKLGIGCFRGSEDDVLSRVLGAAKKFKADIIVELTGDCPLIDPEIVAQVIDCYRNNDCDYASNCDPNTYPIGMDTQVFSTDSLETADKEGLTPADREHVSLYIRKRPEKFKQSILIAPPHLKRPDIQVTLDEKDDYELIRRILQKLYPANKYFSCLDIIKACEEEPALLEINRAVKRRYCQNEI